MSKHINNLSSSSNISVDSLDGEFHRKSSIVNGSDENIDTILVPFYEKDVLMKVPKEQKNKRSSNRQSFRDGMVETQSSYLVNKHRARRTTYLEMFRKQITPHQNLKNAFTNHEIRSISPEVGDTERGSINDEPNNPITDFYNTESYNEIYYEKLMTQDIENFMNNSYEEIQYADDRRGNDKSPHDLLIENLRSVSEVTQPHRRARRATIDPPLDNVKLGGLGPDMETIKPRLDRAKSLQRYSEKVRMENRVKIYKKSVQVENELKVERDRSISRPQKSGSDRSHTKRTTNEKDDPNASYLMNKGTEKQQASQIFSKLYCSKSADVKKSKAEVTKPMLSKEKPMSRPKNDNFPTSSKDKKIHISDSHQARAKSNTKNKRINTDKGRDVPPVHINFMVNVGGVRPSSALRTLEEKHRKYQEQVKAFKMENGNM